MVEGVQIELCLAEREDIQQILEISNRAAENTYANFATEPETVESWLRAWEATHEKYPWIVAKQASAVIGFAKATYHRPRGAYAWASEVSVYVVPELHRGGIGRALYRRLIATMRAQGFVTLIAVITPPNPGSEGLHAACGFRPCGLLHRVGWKFGRWFDVGYWDLELQSSDAPPPSIRRVRDVWDATE